MIYLIGILVLAALITFVYIMGSYFSGLPILNYHKISSGNDPDFLTVTTRQLRQHFEYLNNHGYTTIFLSELLDRIENKKPLPAKPVMITLDDGYRDNYTSLYPLLKEYNIKANIFLVAGFIQAPDQQHVHPNAMGEFMYVDEAIAMTRDQVQFGLHTYTHQSYSKLSLDEIDKDLQQTKQRLFDLGIPFQPCHAYTFGAYNQKDIAKQKALFNLLQKHGVRCAFRVSNWVDKWPLKNKYCISRIHVSGMFSFLKFRIALWGFIKIINRFETFFR